MGLDMRWVGEEAYDRVAEARLYSSAPGMRDLPSMRDRLRLHPEMKPGDVLLAEGNGRVLGTATQIGFQMWVRGGAVPCQGVAWVGAIKTERRKGASRRAPGVATAVMWEVLKKARETEQVVSALMPFRASFYEHFGYGVVERRNEWTFPLSVLPAGDFDGFRFVTDADWPAVAACKQRMVEAGQCEIERSPDQWTFWRTVRTNGFTIIDRPNDTGPVHSTVYFEEFTKDGKTYVKVLDWAADSIPAARRILYWLASLRDQYTAAEMVFPADWPINRWLRETQLPHRPVEHAVASYRPMTRIQVRILDHRRFLEAIHWTQHAKGKAVVAVRESEGIVAKFELDVSRGRAGVKPTNATAEIECSDRLWAAVACGDLPASVALRMGLLEGTSGAAALLDNLSYGPAPFCQEYF